MRERRTINNIEIYTVEDGEFGGVYTVKLKFLGNLFPVYLYASPPEFPEDLDHYNNKLTPIGGTEFPAILFYKQSYTQVGVHAELKKGDTFLARKMPGHEGILEVVLFTAKDNKDPEMPETGDAIEITQKGYVLAKQVKPANREEIKFEQVEGTIFPNADLIADVKQNNFGDCFLLASALAVLHRSHGEDYIKSMMMADGDYTIVRLFHPETLQPCYIRVRNSYYHHDGKNKVLHDAPWVHILEKAYTAFAMKSAGDHFKTTFPAFREVFGDGGNPADAMTMLTGERAVNHKINQEQNYPLDPDHLTLCLTTYFGFQKLHTMFSGLDNSIACIHDYLIDQNKYILPEIVACMKQNKDISAIIDEVALIEARHGAIQSIIPALTAIKDKVDPENHSEYLIELLVYLNKFSDLKLQGDSVIEKSLQTMREFVDFGEYLFALMQKYGRDLGTIFKYSKNVTNAEELIQYFQFLENPPISFPEECLARLREFAFSNEQKLDAPLGVGDYSLKSLSIFNDIKQKLDDENESFAISAITQPKFEFKVPGLRNRHVYSVVRHEEDQFGKYIVVRNPWGHTGREYHFDELRNGEDRHVVSENRENAESRVELSDFVKYFKSYSVGKFNADQIQHSYHFDQTHQQPGFFKRHWGKILVGALVVAAIVVAGVFTFGAAPAITAGVIAGFALTGVTLGTTAAAAIGITAIAVVSAAAGALFGAIAGKIKDVCTRPPAVEYQALPTEEPIARRSSTANLLDVFEYDNQDKLFVEDPVHHQEVCAIELPKDKEDIIYSHGSDDEHRVMLNKSF